MNSPEGKPSKKHAKIDEKSPRKLAKIDEKSPRKDPKQTTLDFFRKPIVQPIIKLTKKVKQQQEMKQKKREAKEKSKVIIYLFIFWLMWNLISSCNKWNEPHN